MSYDLYASRMVQIWTTVRIGNLNLMVILTEITIVRNCMWVGGKKNMLTNEIGHFITYGEN